VNLGTIVKEYFLGTETRKLRELEQGVYAEYVSDRNLRDLLIRRSKSLRRVHFWAMRVVPNLVSLTSIVYAISRRDPIYLMGLSCEMLRAGSVYWALANSGSEKEFVHGVLQEVRKVRGAENNPDDYVRF
jgi:hypothetical protein